MLPLSPSPFLKHLSTLFPATSPLQNPYHYIAGIVYAANNLPQDAAATYQHALLTLPQSATSITRIFREALFKTGVLYGAPRMINALLEAGKWIPDGVPSDEEGYRDPETPIEVLRVRGEELFKEIYGEKAEGVRKMLRGVHPDFDYHMNSLVYGPVYAYNGILGGAETSLAMIAALVGVDAALQVSWHTDGALRHGATQEEVDAVLAIAKAVVERIAQGRREQ